VECSVMCQGKKFSGRAPPRARAGALGENRKSGQASGGPQRHGTAEGEHDEEKIRGPEQSRRETTVASQRRMVGPIPTDPSVERTPAAHQQALLRAPYANGHPHSVIKHDSVHLTRTGIRIPSSGTSLCTPRASYRSRTPRPACAHGSTRRHGRRSPGGACSRPPVFRP